MKFAFAKHIHFQLSLGSELAFVILALFLVLIKWLSSLDLQGKVKRIIKLFLGSLWQSQCLEHLFVGIFEFGSEPSWLGETQNPIDLNQLVLLILALVSSIEWIELLQEVPIRDDLSFFHLSGDFVLILDILRLVPRQLVVGQVPSRYLVLVRLSCRNQSAP